MVCCLYVLGTCSWSTDFYPHLHGAPTENGTPVPANAVGTKGKLSKPNTDGSTTATREGQHRTPPTDIRPKARPKRDWNAGTRLTTNPAPRTTPYRQHKKYILFVIISNFVVDLVFCIVRKLFVHFMKWTFCVNNCTYVFKIMFLCNFSITIIKNTILRLRRLLFAEEIVIHYH